MSFQGNDDKERVQAATDLARIIGEHVQLRPKGRELAGLCPFHDDKTPSMFVSTAKQIYKCFSCGAGGDCFSFVMDYHKMDFREALKYLADRAGIALTPFKPGGGGDGSAQSAGGGSSARKRLLAANERALAFFIEQLEGPAGQIARNYIAQRGIDPAMVQAFQLGYAPDAWSTLADRVAANDDDLIAFDKAGLILQRSGGSYRDKFVHRLTFPICDDLGRPVAFGGRVLPDQKVTASDNPDFTPPKYLNTAETPLFNKSATLYGLNLAKKPIIDSKTAVIVEGYTDVIACHQHGATNVVAALGTAFTSQHASKLRRFCEKVVLVFDGDAAGQKAADRAVEVLLTSEIDVAIAVLPGGKDPDELLATEGGLAAWNELVDNADDALRYLLGRLQEAMDASGTITGKQAVATEFLTRLARHGVAHLPAIRRALIVGQLSGMLHLSESQIMAELKRLAPRVRPSAGGESGAEVREEPLDQGYSQPLETGFDVRYEEETSDSVAPAVSGARLRSIMLAQRQLIGCLLRDNNLFERTLRDGSDFCESLPPGELTPEHRRIYQFIHDRLCDGADLTLQNVLGELAELGWDAERRLVTHADVELDGLLAEGSQTVEQVFMEHAHAIQRFAHERAYALSRRSMGHANAAGPEPTTQPDAVQAALEQAERARRLLEQRRDQPSSGRIARQSG